jgi:hypothetical protein
VPWRVSPYQAPTGLDGLQQEFVATLTVWTSPLETAGELKGLLSGRISRTVPRCWRMYASLIGSLHSASAWPCLPIPAGRGGYEKVLAACRASIVSAWRPWRRRCAATWMRP